MTGAALLVSETLIAQGSTDEAFTRDASSAFAEFANQAKYGSFHSKSVVESFVKHSHLTKKDGNETLGWWGIWEGQNSSGKLTLFATIPDPMNNQQNHVWIRFDPPTESPLAPAVLAHLLGKHETPA